LIKRCTMLLAASLLASSVSAGDDDILVIEDAWVRALPPTQKVTAAYLTVSNRGSEPVAIIGGEVDIAAEVQIHTTREIEGYMRMERLQQLDIPPGGSASLAPGGTHLMLMQLGRMPTVGEKIPLCLTLARGQSVCTEAAVRKTSAAGKHDHHHHQDH